MVYLDYAATTPLDPQILASMSPYLTTEFGNASSVHGYGRDARMAIERSRSMIAATLGVLQGEILFTGSASEANNLALKGVAEYIVSNLESNSPFIFANGRDGDFLPEIVVSSIEHPCVMEAARHIERLGWAKVVWLPVTQSGHVQTEDVVAAINERTILVSVMYVNNEIGSVQPIKAIADLVKTERRNRKTNQSTLSNQLPIWMHTDAVQAVQYFDCSPATLGVDLMTLAPHKCYGPKGIGVLYKSENISLVRQIDGGGQEYYLRAGTENVANVVGAAEALDNAVRCAKEGHECSRLSDLRYQLCKMLNLQATNANNQIIINDQFSIKSKVTELAAPHILSVLIKECDAEALVAALDREGFAVSSGSACSSGVVKKSHVTEALNLGWNKYAPIRVSMGRETTYAQLLQFSKLLPEIVERIRGLGL